MLKDVKKLSELDVENVQEFVYNFDFYKRDTKLRDILNKMLSANIKHVFSNMSKDSKTSKHVDLGCERILIVNNKGLFVEMWNSEWGAIEYAN